ncbi:hypothetical protein [Bacillus salipaludis]|uniref:Uncharacterized protein n=1 Tax=Bacillus salipaludis TaxID=2547811 RepID=A0ABW8RGW4_9BACI
MLQLLFFLSFGVGVLGVEKKVPDTYDWIGEVVCLIGVSIMP